MRQLEVVLAGSIEGADLPTTFRGGGFPAADLFGKCIAIELKFQPV
jgi:hypothetical protein